MLASKEIQNKDLKINKGKVLKQYCCFIRKLFHNSEQKQTAALAWCQV